MMSHEFQALVHPLRRAQTRIWWAYTALPFVAVGVAHYSQSLTPLLADPWPPLFPEILAIISGGIALSSLGYWRYRYSNAYLQGVVRHPVGVDALVAATHKAEPLLRVRLEALPAFERQCYWVVLSFTKPLVINLAMNQIIAFLGLQLVFGTPQVSAIIPFATVALLLNLLIFPRIDTLLERSKRWQP